MRGSAGFTFIELIIVLLIIAIMGVLVMRPASYLPQIRELEAASKVKSDIRYAQSYALSSQQRTCVSFNTTAQTYSVYYENPPGSWVLFTDPLNKSNFTVNIGTAEFSGVNMTQTNFNGVGNGIVFDDAGKPYGCNVSCGGIALLASQGSVTFSGGTVVTLEPNTGKVQ